MLVKNNKYINGTEAYHSSKFCYSSYVLYLMKGILIDYEITSEEY